MSRTVAYVDLGRALQGNETLQVYSSPLLKEVVRKAIGRSGKHSHSSSKNAFSAPSSSLSPSSSPSSSTPGKSSTYPNVQFMSGVRSDEPSFAFLGNLGIPFIHLCVTNAPKVKLMYYTCTPISFHKLKFLGFVILLAITTHILFLYFHSSKKIKVCSITNEWKLHNIISHTKLPWLFFVVSSLNKKRRWVFSFS